MDAPLKPPPTSSTMSVGMTGTMMPKPTESSSTVMKMKRSAWRDCGAAIRRTLAKKTAESWRGPQPLKICFCRFLAIPARTLPTGGVEFHFGSVRGIPSRVRRSWFLPRTKFDAPHTFGAGRHQPWRESMPTGTVKWFNASKGFGFIQPDDKSKDVFVHVSAVERAGLGNLNENQKISYELEQGQNGKTSAVDLKTV